MKISEEPMHSALALLVGIGHKKVVRYMGLISAGVIMG
ncbi:hypothetical protein ABID39_000305 [Bartonella japonica]|uniref:Uncharacterized protein n=1 Tax=Bartonella japonica TaxID=357761 RepID=A0ABV2FM50_9HYPH